MQQSHFLKVRNSTVKTSILYFFGDIDFKGLNNTDNITNKKSSHVESFSKLSNHYNIFNK